MAIKSILCIFEGGEDELDCLNKVMGLARGNKARLTVLHISRNPEVYTGLYGEGAIASGDVIEAIEKHNARMLEQARAHVTEMAGRHGLPLDQPDASTQAASVEFINEVGSSDAIIAQYGRVNDLVAIARRETPSQDCLTPALFDTARPVLAMPPGQAGESVAEWLPGHVAVAWDGGFRAARALYNALPFLAAAEKLDVLIVGEHGKRTDAAAEQRVVDYLRAHGLTPKLVEIERGDRSVGQSLLEEAGNRQARMLVMGAYGHSMLREMVLGGVTEHILHKAELPLLLSH